MQTLFKFQLNCGFSASHCWAAVAVALVLVEVMVVNGAEGSGWFQAIGRHWLPETVLCGFVFVGVVAVDRRLGKRSSRNGR